LEQSGKGPTHDNYGVNRQHEKSEGVVQCANDLVNMAFYTVTNKELEFRVPEGSARGSLNNLPLNYRYRRDLVYVIVLHRRIDLDSGVWTRVPSYSIKTRTRSRRFAQVPLLY
jgi:hypothetical protein